jgi:nucleoid DNA-binding protein
VRTKRDLDLDAAVALGISQREVTKVTSAFVAELRQALVDEGVVSIPGLGKLSVYQVLGPQHHNLTPGKNTKRVGKRPLGIVFVNRVGFTMSPTLKGLLKEKHNAARPRRRNGKVRRR